MKTFRLLAAVLSMLFLFEAVPAYAAEYVILTRGTKARVLQIIDGDALKVELPGGGGTALVRLAGISTQGYTEAFEYMASAVLGSDVELRLDETYTGATAESRWTPVYVYRNNVFYNRSLLQKGFARVDEAYRSYTMYNTFLNDERSARGRGLGLWAVNAPSGGYQVRTSDTCINVNTATASQLQSILPDITSTQARAVVSYRESAPFRDVREVKFTNTFSREAFEECVGYMTVCTNINTATNQELRYLGFTASEASAAVSYRNKTSFDDPSRLHTEKILAYDKFREIEPYISVYDSYQIEHAIPDKTADINRSTAEALHAAGSDSGLTLNKARLIEDGRANGYTVKWLGEIQKISGISLTDSQLNGLSDNLLTEAGYDTRYAQSYVNLNTASYTALLDAGFSQAQASAVVRAQSRRMRTGRDIPVALGALDAAVTLHTNINAASASELLSLSDHMTAYFASVLADAASRQPFGTMSELQDFCDEYDEDDLYYEIREYIVLR